MSNCFLFQSGLFKVSDQNDRRRLPKNEELPRHRLTAVCFDESRLRLKDGKQLWDEATSSWDGMAENTDGRTRKAAVI